MNPSRIAVWLLELVTAPDRAATTVGDFVEESVERGPFWFWRQIVQTFVAQVGREFISAGPGLILKCVLRSVAYLFASFATGLLIASLLWFRVPSGKATPLAWVLLASIPFLVRAGWLLAEKTSRPITSTSIFAIVCFLLTRNPNDVIHPYGPWISLLVLIGAIWQRRLSLRAA